MSPRILDRSAIIEAALKILSEEGLAALSLRRVASQLNVKAASLYWHFPDKRALLGSIAEHIFRECLAQVPPDGDWRQWLRNLGITIWKKQCDIRDIRLLMIQARMDPQIIGEFSDTMTNALLSRGIDPQIAFDAQRSVTTLATGWTMIPNDPEFQNAPIEPSFLRTLDAMIRGWNTLGRDMKE